MASSIAKTVEQYRNSLPDNRAELIRTIRTLFLEHLPEGFEETMNWGMISYEVPLETYPNTYNKKPLLYAAIAAQKNNYAIYLNNMYMNSGNHDKIAKAFNKIGVKPNMGKSCIRFTRFDKIPVDAIVKVFASSTLESFIKEYEDSREK